MARSKEEILAAIDSEIAAGMGGKFSSGELSRERARAMDYYLGRPFGNEQKGRSSVIIHDVAEAVDNLMPSLLRVFTTADNLVKFNPVGPEDVETADQETDVVNHVFWKQNTGFVITYTWLKDALLQKNGIVQAFWDETEEETREEYESLTEDELAVLLDDEELEAIEQEERTELVPVDLPPELQQLAGIEQAPIERTVFDVVFKRKTKKGQVKIDNIPPEEFIVSNDLTSLNLNEARFVGRVSEKTKQDLINMGFDEDEVLSLPSKDASVLDTEEEISRKNLSDESGLSADTDPLMALVDLTEAYIRFDWDEDGIAELRQVLKVGGNILSNERVDRQPFHAWTPNILPHKFFGLSLADNTWDIQLIRSTLVRQMLDNLYLANQPRKVLWEDAIGDTTMDEILTSRVGGTIRVTKPVGEAIRDENTPFVAGQAFPMLDFFSDRMENRTGVGQDVAGLGPDALKNIQTTVVAQMMDMSTMQLETYARIFAETGMKSLMLHIHELLRKHAPRELVFRIRNKWVQVDPQGWRNRADMSVAVGLGTGTREQKLIHLQAIRDLQTAIIQGGGLGTLVTPTNVYNTAKEFVTNALFPDPDMFFQDPSGLPPEAFEPKPDPQEQFIQLQAQIEQGKLQLQAQKQQLDAEKAALDHQRRNSDLEMKQQRVQLEALRTDLEQQQRVLEANARGVELNQSQQKIDQAERELDIDAEKAMNDLLTNMEQIQTRLMELELRFNVDIPNTKLGD